MDGQEKRLDCPHCAEPLAFLVRENIQLGEHTFFGGDLGNLLSGSLPVTMYVCPRCGHLELFTSRRPKERPREEQGAYVDADTTGFYTPGTGPEVKCPRCGKLHPEDDDDCPLCGLRRKAP